MGRRLGRTNAEKRRAVLEAAAVLVAERGRAVPLKDICGRAGVSRQTVYNHHGDKRGLFAAVCAEGLDPCPACPAGSDLELEERLSRYAATLLAWIHAPERMTALRACGQGVGVGGESFARRTAAAAGRLAELLREETLRGRWTIPQPTVAARLFLDLVLAGPQLAALLGLTELATPAEQDARARACARLFVRGCGPGPVPDARTRTARLGGPHAAATSPPPF